MSKNWGLIKWGWRTRLVIGGLGLAIILVMYTSYQAGNATSANTSQSITGSILPVRVITVRHLDGYESEHRYVGRIVSHRTGDIGFERVGRIAEIMVDEGSSVTKGQPLARLTTDVLHAESKTVNAQLAHARAEHRVALVKLEFMRTTLKRQSQLLKADNVSQKLYDEANFEAEAAHATVAAAAARIREVEAAIEQIDLEISLSTIHAPFDGHVAARLVDEGTTVSAGSLVLRIIEIDALDVRAGVPAKVAAELNINQHYPIEIDGRIVEAPLSAILEEVVANTHAVPAIFRLEDPSFGLPGQIARVIVRRKNSARGFWVPVTGLTEGRRGLWNAYALEPSSSNPEVFKLSRRDVKLIHNTATDAFVVGTLSDGDRLVTTGLHRLTQGQLVRIP